MVCKHVFSASAINADHVIPGHGLLRAVLVPNDWFYLHVQAVPQRLPQYSLCCASIALSKKLPNLWRGIPYALELLPQRFQMGQAAGAFSFPLGSHVGGICISTGGASKRQAMSRAEVAVVVAVAVAVAVAAADGLVVVAAAAL